MPVYDGSSPLTQFLGILYDATFWLPLAIDRDRQAITILSEPGLPEVVRRTEARYWGSYLQAKDGKFRLHPRIWTQHDVREWNLRHGRASGWHPTRRTYRIITKLFQRLGKVFPAVVAELRKDQSFAFLAPKCDAAKASFDLFLNHALETCNCTRGGQRFEELKKDVDSHVCELLTWAKEHRPSADFDATGGLRGVTYHDIADWISGDDPDEAVVHAEEWRSSKMFHGMKTIGNDPRKGCGNRKLAELAEITKFYFEFASHTQPEKDNLKVFLIKRLQVPKRKI